MYLLNTDVYGQLMETALGEEVMGTKQMILKHSVGVIIKYVQFIR